MTSSGWIVTQNNYTITKKHKSKIQVV